MGIRLTSYRHPVAQSAAAAEGDQEPATVRGPLWRRLGSGGERGTGPPRGSLGRASSSVRAKDRAQFSGSFSCSPRKGCRRSGDKDGVGGGPRGPRAALRASQPECTSLPGDHEHPLFGAWFSAPERRVAPLGPPAPTQPPLLFWVLILNGLVGLHRTVQLQLLQRYWLGHMLGLL